MDWLKQYEKIFSIVPAKAAQTNGYSIIEVVVILLVFTSMFIVILNLFQFSIAQLNVSRAKIVATEIANEQMEILRNLRYNDVGTVNGSPTGTIDDTRTVVRSNITFSVTTVIQYVDDPFDGCVGEVLGHPEQSKCADGTIVNKIRDIPANSNNPADYKKTDVTVTWAPYYAGLPVKLSTIIAPKGLEGDTEKGFLLIHVINASGEPLHEATVNITNTQVIPNINITRTTDTAGNILLLDLEPSLNSYVIKVSKDEYDKYSSDRTCSTQVDGTACTDSEGVPNPVQGNISVYQGELEEVTFAIDQVSTLNFRSYDESCVELSGINFTLQSSLRPSQLGKKISTEPTPDGIPKTTIEFSSPITFTDLEWDYYDLFVNTAGYDIAGINHDLALNVLPNTNTTVNVLLASSTPHSLLITVKDSGTQTNLAGANVQLTKDGYDETKITGQGFIEQTDWSGSPPSYQVDFIDETKYFSDDGHLDTTSTTGQITLKKNSPSLFFTEDFDDSIPTYKDGVNTTADWNTDDQELKLPTSGSPYPLEMHYAQTTKLNSQHGKIVSATLTANEQLNGQTINYFLSADGGTNFESVTLGNAHTFVNVGSDLRIRVELITTDENVTPKVLAMTLNYTIEYFDSSGELISSTFDLGSAADFTTLSWQASQPPETGTESVKFQIATNNDNSTWNFLGPDGTTSTYYTESNADIHDNHNGDQYLRYKLFLYTDDIYYSPSFTDMRIGFTLECLPPGQVYFKNLSQGEYSINVTLTGYQDYTDAVDVNGYTTKEVLLTPTP